MTDSERQQYRYLVLQCMDSAPDIQDMIWDDYDFSRFDAEKLVNTLAKKFLDIYGLDLSNKETHAVFKKRLLQIASLSLRGIVQLKELKDHSV